MASSSTNSGRPRDSCVWKYCKYVENDKKSICVVIKSDGQSFNGKFTTNLKGHLKRCHAKDIGYLRHEREDGQKE